jgi:hypothetical protein
MEVLKQLRNKRLLRKYSAVVSRRQEEAFS